MALESERLLVPEWEPLSVLESEQSLALQSVLPLEPELGAPLAH